jgi:diguanylate cyclase (GGDEF)-like protein
LATSLASVAGFRSYGLDLNPLALDAAGILFGVGLLRHDLFELAFVGRERVVEALQDCIVLLDPDGRIADANPAARLVLGLGEGFVGTMITASGIGASLAPLASGQMDRLEFVAEGGKGLRKYSARASRVEGSRGESFGTALIITDVTETAALLARLTELAVTDELTGLSNRRCFFERARQEFEVAKRGGRPLSLVILDLDHFKLVNDEYGHEVGDVVLRGAAARMLGQLRYGDLLCRYGGEEFAILMPETDCRGAVAAAERVRGAVGEGLIEFEGGSILITASAGVYGAVPAGCEGLEDFLRRADAALYDAKARGRDRLRPWAAVERKLPC